MGLAARVNSGDFVAAGEGSGHTRDPPPSRPLRMGNAHRFSSKGLEPGNGPSVPVNAWDANGPTNG